MYHDDSQKGTGNSLNKRSSARHNESVGNSYNSIGNSYGNYNSYPSQHNYGQQRRRPERYNKQNGNGSNDKLIKQNELIIKLLREIRDRLPEPVKEEKPADTTAPASQETPPQEVPAKKEKKASKKRTKKDVKKEEKKETDLQEELEIN